MAPIKFEEQLKDKLEKRSLQPSVDSWAKLSQRIDTEEKRTKKPWLGWLSIAAGLIIFLAIAIQTFGSKPNQNIAPVIATEKEEIDNKQLNKDEAEVIKLAIEDEQTEEKINTNKNREQPEIINYKAVIQKKKNVKVQLANTSATKKIKVDTLNNMAQPEIIENAVVSIMDEFKSENKAVTDREVDSLLKLASKELFKDKLRKETSKTVDADALLKDVEEAMGQSFRSKVFEALKGSYETVKTAVAERNN